MKTEIKAYWHWKRKEARFIDIHIPNFKSKEEIDKYIENGNQMADYAVKNKSKGIMPDDDDDF